MADLARLAGVGSLRANLLRSVSLVQLAGYRGTDSAPLPARPGVNVPQPNAAYRALASLAVQGTLTFVLLRSVPRVAHGGTTWRFHQSRS
jgi:hypothetical protein